MSKIESIKKNIITYLCVSLFAAVSLAVFAPVELYLSNKDFFFFKGNELFGLIGLAFAGIILITLALLIIGELLGEKIAAIVLGLGFGLVLAIYVQGNFLPGDYGSLDGRAIDWSQYRVRGCVSVIMFIVLVGLFIFLAIKLKKEQFYKVCRVLSVCIILVQLMTLTTLYIQKGGFGKANSYLATTENEFNYSSEENFVILMLDSFEGRAMDKIIEEDQTGEYKAILKDFNFYPDTAGMYKSTGLALPHLLFGKEYLNDQSFEEYLESSYKEAPILKELGAQDWYTGIYNLNRMPRSQVTLMGENCKEIELTVGSHRRLGEYMAKLIGFRYMPQPLKQYFWFYGDDINNKLMDTKEDVELYSDVNLTFAADIDSARVESDRKTFHFYELLGAHQPYHLTADFTESVEETDELETGKGLLVMLGRYTDKLKELGVYDNTTIIVLADHGTELRRNPLFMVKYANSDHELVVDQTPFSYAYLQELYLGILAGKSEEECSELIKAHEGQVREFLLYEDNEGTNDKDYFTADIFRCEIRGRVTDEDAMQFGQEVYKCVE